MKLGRPVLPLVREALQQTRDPEVKQRAQELLDALNDLADMPRFTEMLVLLRTQSFTNKSLAGKRYVVKITQAELEGAAPNNTHMFEMAPAPMD